MTTPSTRGLGTVSVVTPHLRQLPLLKRCVGSLRGQHGNPVIEHFVEDGASADGTAQWAAEQPDLHFHSQHDSTPYAAIQRGWGRASGSILSWLNADEQYLPGTVDRVLHTFSQHPDTDMVFGDAIIVDAAGAPRAYRKPPPLRKPYIASSYLYTLSCTLFFHRRLLDNGQLTFNPSLRYAADMELLLRLLTDGIRIKYLNAPLALFGVGNDNLSRDAAMGTETATIRRDFSATRYGLPAQAWNLLRLTEKLIHGCYRKRYAVYAYAEDETPTYRTVEATIPHRFKFQ